MSTVFDFPRSEFAGKRREEMIQSRADDLSRDDE